MICVSLLHSKIWLLLGGAASCCYEKFIVQSQKCPYKSWQVGFCYLVHITVSSVCSKCHELRGDYFLFGELL